MTMTSELPESEGAERFARELVGRLTADGPLLLDQILPQVYDEFRSLAAYLMRGEKDGHTLRPTALANEAYLRLADQPNARLQGRAHLLSLAATMMRRVLVDYARTRGAIKRGAGQERVTLDDRISGGAGSSGIDLLDLHRALEHLGALSTRKVKVVELIYFGGLSFEEVSAVLDVSKRTVVRDWRSAKAWLWNELLGRR
jgi:RNA polymerase sigma factor (TIGR02999 family)